MPAATEVPIFAQSSQHYSQSSQHNQSQPQAQVPPPPQVVYNRGFNIGHQKVGLDINFANKSLKGWTEITINPTEATLKQLRLNCRQCKITKCLVNGKSPSLTYKEPYSSFKIHDTATVHQHHQLMKKLDPALSDPPEHELVIHLPPKVKIESVDPLSVSAQNPPVGRSNPGIRRESPDIAANGAMTPALPRSDTSFIFSPLKVRIEYVIEHVRDGFTFVGCDAGDQRYPHAYTTHTPLPGSACCLFPTLDGIHERWTWEIEVTVPKTIGDIEKTSSQSPSPQVNGNGPVANGINGVNGTHESPDEMGAEDVADEDGDLDMTVVCSGNYKDEETHPTESWKKTLKFEQLQAVAPQHISIAAGPFERVNLSEYRDVETEEAMGTMSVDVLGYSLPGREPDLRNTCMFIPKALDYIFKEFGQYVFQAFKVCFVDDLAMDTTESASLVICSNRLLFPEHVIDPIWPVTRKLTYALATQWSGVQVVPKDWQDTWVIIGIAYWMTGCFLKTLMGNNEYRFRLKRDAEKICELDIGRPSLYAAGFAVPIDQGCLDFIKLKAPVVLTILEKRLWKVSSSMVLHRVVRKTFLGAVAGELKNGLMSTKHFIRVCEKSSHTKLDPFFQQWVYGSGYPRFEVSQRFNKKRMIVEMGIRQVQATETPTHHKVTAESFFNDAQEHVRHIAVGPPLPLFTGPMTIRIHEADGTPYEHVVDIKDTYTKLDIPYNTKYKRLKRSRRQKERAAAGAGVDISIDAQNDDVLLYCLGDVLQSEEEVEDWRLEDWSKEDEDKMAQESFEWIRMDADFEWICTLKVGQPDYMFLSQLQQDRDVIAQYEALQHLASIKESALISSILVRTLMDRRYYHGIRTEAALALSKCATADLAWVGQFHLMKAFQEFFCFPGSAIPRSNDFTDFTSYYVQKAIPTSMSRIRNLSGACPTSAQKWLLDVLRYNDNSNNNFDDCHYVANLMKALANTLTLTKNAGGEFGHHYEFEDDEAAATQEAAIREILRYQRMDQWQPTYQNIVSEVSLEIRRDLTLLGVKDAKMELFMSYTREGTLETLRAKAFDCMIDLGALRTPVLIEYICKVIGTDPSAYIRKRVYSALVKGLGMVATGDDKSKVKDEPDMELGEMMIIEDGGDSSSSRKDELARETISGAIASLKKEIGEDKVLKESLWKACTSQDIGLLELRDLTDICRLLYSTKDSLIVVMKRPRHLRCEHIGKAVLRFKWSYDLAAKPLPVQLKPLKLITTPKPRVNGTPVGRKTKDSRPNIERTPSISKSAPKSTPKSTPKLPGTPRPSATPKASSSNNSTPRQSHPKAPKIVLKLKNPLANGTPRSS